MLILTYHLHCAKTLNIVLVKSKWSIVLFNEVTLQLKHRELETEKQEGNSLKDYIILVEPFVSIEQKSCCLLFSNLLLHLFVKIPTDVKK